MATMCGMNKVNNTLSCENSDLLNKYLKSSVGFPGMVFPDVSAQTITVHVMSICIYFVPVAETREPAAE